MSEFTIKDVQNLMNFDWVSVESGIFPPVETSVIVYTRNGKMVITSRYTSVNGDEYWKGSGTFKDSITHWRYLPEPPIK